MQERNKPYRQLIQSLNSYRTELGIPEEPNAVVQVPKGIGSPARPGDSLLPVYCNSETESEPGQSEKVLFNLKSLVGFDPREISKHQTAKKEQLLDKIGQSLSDRTSYPPKPEKIFTKFHKRRKPPSKATIARRAAAYKKWKDVVDAINTEKATPIDEGNPFY